MPSTLDNYTDLKEIVSLAGTTLYLARDAQRAASVLLVVLDARRGAPPRGQIRDIVARTPQVIDALSVFGAHEGLAQLREPLHDALGVVYAHAGGIPLQTWRARYGAATPRDAIACTMDILALLEALHARGIVHRGLSPIMVWVDDAPTLRLRTIYGLGLAELVQSEQRWAETATIQSDVRFMAPEQFTGEALDARTDLYSVGLLLHAMLSDVPAIEDASLYAQVQAHCEGRLAAISPPGRASDGLRRIVNQALARHPKDRFHSAQQMREALAQQQGPSTRGLPSVHTTQVYAHPTKATGEHPPSPPLRKAEGMQNGRTAPHSTPTPTSPPRIDPSRYARSVDVSAVERSHTRRGFPWRIVVLAWLVAMMLGGVTLWRLQNGAGPDAPTPGDGAMQADGPLDCRWTHVARALPVGETELSFVGDANIQLSYDRMNVRVMQRRADDAQPLRYIRAFGSVELWHRQMPEASRDWLFLLPRVRHAQRPSLWALQFDGDRLVSSQRIPLGLETIEHARVKLRPREGECMLWVRVEGDRGPGPDDKEIWLRMTEPGMVVEHGALGGLWAPELDQSPL